MAGKWNKAKLVKEVNQIEVVQRRAARWTCSNFDRNASVAEMLNNLGSRSLEQRRADVLVALIRFYMV